MKWWHKGLALTAIWVLVCLGVCFFYTPPKEDPVLDAKLSEMLGEVCGAGLLAIWAILYARMKYMNEE